MTRWSVLAWCCVVIACAGAGRGGHTPVAQWLPENRLP